MSRVALHPFSAMSPLCIGSVFTDFFVVVVDCLLLFFLWVVSLLVFSFALYFVWWIPVQARGKKWNPGRRKTKVAWTLTRLTDSQTDWLGRLTDWLGSVTRVSRPKINNRKNLSYQFYSMKLRASLWWFRSPWSLV